MDEQEDKILGEAENANANGETTAERSDGVSSAENSSVANDTTEKVETSTSAENPPEQEDVAGKGGENNSVAESASERVETPAENPIDKEQTEKEPDKTTVENAPKQADGNARSEKRNDTPQSGDKTEKQAQNVGDKAKAQVAEPKAEDKSDKADLKDKGDKKAKKQSDKADKKVADKDKKSEAKLKKEWEDSIVASKRVKREEIRRKFKQAMVIMLVFALVVTSIVYVMLLFIQENNVRITANSKDKDTSISLSMDNSMWTPYLNAHGPESIWDISYNTVYNREKIDTVDDVRNKLSADYVQVGAQNGEKFIRFVFMVKNTGKYDATLNYEMTLNYDRRGLQDAVRVMWGESFKSGDPEGEDFVDVRIYASRSTNGRLKGTQANYGATEEDGFIEFVAYPFGSDDPSFNLLEYEQSLQSPDAYANAREKGYFATTPFVSENYVFQEHATLAQGDIMYCYVCIWVEGSDFDCVDSALGGYVTLGINFTAF